MNNTNEQLNEQLKNITWLAQSTWLWETSLEKWKYIYYKNQENWEIDSAITLRLNQVKDILDLDFEIKNPKEMYKYTSRNVIVSYNFSNGSWYKEIQIPLDIQLNELATFLENIQWEPVVITNIIDNFFHNNYFLKEKSKQN